MTRPWRPCMRRPYLIEAAGESWRVLGCVSERDQEEEMRALGLL